MGERPESEAAEAVRLWNDAAEKMGWPAVRVMTRQRAGALRQRLATGGLAMWAEALAKAEASDFLAGTAGRSPAHASWRMNIDTMLRESFFARLLEGTYDNADPSRTAVASAVSDDDAQWLSRLSGLRRNGFWMGNWWGPKPGETGCRVPAHLLQPN